MLITKKIIIIIVIIIIIIINPRRQHSKVQYRWEGQKRRKIWKGRSEAKVVAFSSASLFPTRKREAAFTQGGTV